MQAVNLDEESQAVIQFTDEDRNELETLVINNSEPIAEIKAEHIEGTPNADVVLIEADGDRVIIRRLSDPLDPMRPFERRNQ